MTDDKFERKMKKQRAEQGFCDQDAWDVTYWFFLTAGKIIQKIADHYEGYPSLVEDLYYDQFKDKLGDITYEQFCLGVGCCDHPFIGEEFADRVHRWCCKKWRGILRQLARLFANCLEETCSYRNPFEEEYKRAVEEHRAKYPGVLGYGEDVPENPVAHHLPGGGLVLSDQSPYAMWNLPEFKDICDKHDEAQKEIERKLERNRKKALRLFTKYLPNLSL